MTPMEQILWLSQHKSYFINIWSGFFFLNWSQRIQPSNLVLSIFCRPSNVELNQAKKSMWGGEGKKGRIFWDKPIWQQEKISSTQSLKSRLGREAEMIKGREKKKAPCPQAGGLRNGYLTGLFCYHFPNTALTLYWKIFMLVLPLNDSFSLIRGNNAMSET